MEKNKVKGFVTGVLCTVLVGGGIFGGRYVLSNKDHAVNQESVQKAKAIESLLINIIWIKLTMMNWNLISIRG